MMDESEALLRTLGDYARNEREQALPVPAPNGSERAAIERHVLAMFTAERGAGVSGFRSLRKPRRSPRWFAWTLPLSAAAVLLLWELRHDPVVPLASYQLEVTATAADTRGAHDHDTRSVRAGAITTLSLRPATKIAGPVTALLFLQRPAGLEPLPGEVVADAGGAVRVRATLPARLATQNAQLIVLVTRAERLHVAQELARGKADRGPEFQRWSLAIVP
jgi:hypothetical protein